MNPPVEPTPSPPADDLTNLNLALPTDWNYEQTVAQIEVIINRIEVGELELAEIFDQFAIAVEQLRQCETFLDQQKNQMGLLIETLVDGGEEG
jgi:exodeoxyribonuclease VII small subunit